MKMPFGLASFNHHSEAFGPTSQASTSSRVRYRAIQGTWRVATGGPVEPDHGEGGEFSCSASLSKPWRRWRTSCPVSTSHIG